MNPIKRTSTDRRRFLAATGAAATATVIDPSIALGDAANSKLNLGVIGVGGRGAWLADLFVAHGGFRIAAVADYFRDRVDEVGDKHKLPADNRHTGLDCYKKLIAAGGVDAVAIVSPPYFHPEQAKAAVEADLHVWLAKPVAVDAAGCHSVEAAGTEATRRQRCFLVDFQTRANGFYIEAVKRVHAGAIGAIAFGESTYHSGRLAAKTAERSPEARLRNWVFDQKLSGDIITEQNIHALDVMSWVMDKPPVSAMGTGGRKVRVDVGDCWDNFSLVYDYGDGVGVTFSSRQFNGHGTSPSGILNRMFGAEGVLESSYGGNVMVRGKNFYRGGKTSDIYKDGVATNIATFHSSITGGKFDNPTVAPSVRSNLVAILGRSAAYGGRPVSWEELAEDNKRIEPDLSDLVS